jgi:hypothetical protein
MILTKFHNHKMRHNQNIERQKTLTWFKKQCPI